MDCREFRSILDSHDMDKLGGTQLRDAKMHAAACDSCAAEFTAHDALLSETFCGPENGVFESVMKSVFVPCRQIAQRATSTFHWGKVAVAALFVAVVGATVLTAKFRNDASPGQTASVVERDISLLGSPSANQFVEGRDYVRVRAVGLAPASRQVVEAFMYGCHPCYQFEPYINEWASGLSDDVEFVRVPVQWNQSNQLHARAYYAAEVLGLLDSIHRDFFVEIHENGNALSTEDRLAVFFQDHGISEQAFFDAFYSSEVDERLAWAAMLTADLGIDSTPTVVVNGTWLTTGGMARSFEDLLEIVDFLVESDGE